MKSKYITASRGCRQSPYHYNHTTDLTKIQWLFHTWRSWAINSQMWWFSAYQPHYYTLKMLYLMRYSLACPKFANNNNQHNKPEARLNNEQEICWKENETWNSKLYRCAQYKKCNSVELQTDDYNQWVLHPSSLKLFRIFNTGSNQHYQTFWIGRLL